MCGRFALRLGRGEIRNVPGHDGVDADDWVDEDAFVPRYNIAPRTFAPVLRRRAHNNDHNDSSSNEGYVLHSMKWGLVPHWSKHEDKTLSTTNARSENLVSQGGMWASIKGRKRCAVLAQGYYEWLNRGKDKLPHFTKHRDGAIMLMAGLYDSVVLEGQKDPLWTFSIVTTAANKEFEWLHERQPVILSTRAALDAWLDTSSQEWTSELSKLVQPFSDTTHPLECYQVPKEVGKVGSESPTFIEPIVNRKDGIQAMFSKQAQAKTSSQSSSQLKFTPKLNREASPLSRKRSRSPLQQAHLSKKTKSEAKVKHDEDDSDVEIVSGPSTISTNANKVSSTSPRKSPAKRKANAKAKEASSNKKLDSFFQKKSLKP